MSLKISRLRTALLQDIRVHTRYGFWYAAIVVALLWIGLLQAVPEGLEAYWLPFGIFVDLAPIGFFFVAGQQMFEKSERTVFGLVSTPLRFWEYLLAKLASLTLMAVAVTLVVTAVIWLGAPTLMVNWGILTLATVLTSVVVLLLGFCVATPYASISRFLIPSQLVLIPLFLPLLEFFAFTDSALIRLIPAHSMLVLLKAGFASLSPAQVAFHSGYLLLWSVGLSLLAQRLFNRYVVQG